MSVLFLPVVSLLQSFVSVTKPIKLHSDNDGHILHAVLTVQALPAVVAYEVVAGDERVLEAGHDAWSRGEHLHLVHMVLTTV